MRPCPKCKRVSFVAGVVLCACGYVLAASHAEITRDCYRDLCEAIVAQPDDDHSSRDGSPEAPMMTATVAVSGVATMPPSGWNNSWDLPPPRRQGLNPALMDLGTNFLLPFAQATSGV